MMYVQVTGEKANYTTLTDLRFARPDVSFPVTITDKDAALFGVFPCQTVEAPSIDYSKNLELGDPKFENGAWRQSWVVTDASAEQIAERVSAQWSVVRNERNTRLASCDWTQLPDAPVDAAAWAEYRQALRDITEQADPFNIVWPTEPGA